MLHNLVQQQQAPSLLPIVSEASSAPAPKAFVCEICGKAFRFRSNLAEHRSVHTALKPFVCKFCGKSSRLKGNLTKHILKHHKTEQLEYIGTDDYIIKKGKKSVKDPAAIEFLEKSMIVLNNSSGTHSQQSAESDGTQPDQNGGLDNQGILLSLGLEGGSLDLKAELDDGSEEFEFAHMDGIEQQHLEESHHEPVEMVEEDADGAGEETGSMDAQSSSQQSPLDANSFESNANSMANAAASAIFSQMDHKALAKALFGRANANEQKEMATVEQGDLRHPQSTNDEILRILQQVSSLSQSNEPEQQQMATAACSTTTTPKLCTQCQQCGKHFRKPRDLAAHTATAHKSAQQPPQQRSFVNRTGSEDVLATIGRIKAAMASQQSTRHYSTTPVTNGTDDSSTALQHELRDLKALMLEIRAQQSGGGKMEQMLSQLDSRVVRLEKQLEMALNSIYTLVQLQTGINNSVNKLANTANHQQKAANNNQ